MQLHNTILSPSSLADFPPCVFVTVEDLSMIQVGSVELIQGLVFYDPTLPFVGVTKCKVTRDTAVLGTTWGLWEFCNGKR